LKKKNQKLFHTCTEIFLKKNTSSREREREREREKKIMRLLICAFRKFILCCLFLSAKPCFVNYAGFEIFNARVK